jgi:hypothetical protein
MDPRQVLVASLGLFALGVALCGVIAPRGMRINEGTSYYGTHLVTFAPYWLALWSVAGASWFLARHWAHLSTMRWLLQLISALVSVIVFVPYSWNSLFNIIHTTIGSVAFTLALVVSVYGTALAQRRATQRISHFQVARVALFVETASWMLSSWWVLHAHGHLIWAQFAFLLAFLINSIAWLNDEDRSALGDARLGGATTGIH